MENIRKMRKSWINIYLHTISFFKINYFLICSSVRSYSLVFLITALLVKSGPLFLIQYFARQYLKTSVIIDSKTHLYLHRDMTNTDQEGKKPLKILPTDTLIVLYLCFSDKIQNFWSKCFFMKKN